MGPPICSSLPSASWIGIHPSRLRKNSIDGHNMAGMFRTVLRPE